MTANEARSSVIGFCALVMLLLFIASWWLVNRAYQQVLRNNAQLAAESYTETIRNLRSFYTAEVVGRVPRDHVQVTHDYESIEGAIPLPATLTIRLGEMIGGGQEGFAAKLYSDHPFPWRSERELDAFEREAIPLLREGPDSAHVALEDANGNRTLRYATADVMRAECVSCHNTHPDSPKRDWQEGDVRGVLSVSISLAAVRGTSRWLFRGLMLIFLVGAGVLLFGVVILLGRAGR